MDGRNGGAFIAIAVILAVLMIIVGVIGLGGFDEGCDFPGCSEHAFNRGEYGGRVFFCNKHRDVYYCEDPGSGDIVFFGQGNG